MRGASKQRVGYKNTNVLRKSLRKRPRLGSRQTRGEGEERPGGLGSGGWEAHANTQPNTPGRAVRHGRQPGLQTKPAGEGRGWGAVREGAGRGLRAAGLCRFWCAGWGLRPAVLKCMSAAVGSGRVHAAAVAAAAAVVLKRTAPECPAAAAATPTRRRRGPAAPARGRLGPGGGRRQLHRLPALPAAARLGPEPAARAGASTLRTAASPPSPSARRLSDHPRSPLSWLGRSGPAWGVAWLDCPRRKSWCPGGGS